MQKQLWSGYSAPLTLWTSTLEVISRPVQIHRETSREPDFLKWSFLIYSICKIIFETKHKTCEQWWFSDARPFISCLSFSLECSSGKRHLTQEMCCCSSIISMIVRYHPDKSGSSTLLLLKELNSSSVSSEVLRPSCHGSDCRAGSPRPLPTGQHPPNP